MRFKISVNVRFSVVGEWLRHVGSLRRQYLFHYFVLFVQPHLRNLKTLKRSVYYK